MGFWLDLTTERGCFSIAILMSLFSLSWGSYAAF